MTPQRITLSRAKGWRMPKNTVKVDRSTMYGNPWKAGSPGTIRLTLKNVTTDYHLPYDLTVDQAVEAYQYWLANASIYPRQLPENLSEIGRELAVEFLSWRRYEILKWLPLMKGWNLACWCKQGQPCHADTLLHLANVALTHNPYKVFP